jgi:hypothetical protein
MRAATFDTVTKQVLAFDHNVTEIDANPEL